MWLGTLRSVGTPLKLSEPCEDRGLALFLGFCPILSNQNQESELACGVSGWHPSQHMPSFRGLESWSNPFLGSSRSFSWHEW